MMNFSHSRAGKMIKDMSYISVFIMLTFIIFYSRDARSERPIYQPAPGVRSIDLIPGSGIDTSCNTTVERTILDNNQWLDIAIQEYESINQPRDETKRKIFHGKFLGEPPFSFYISPEIKPEVRAFIEKLIKSIKGVRLTAEPLASFNILDYNFRPTDQHITNLQENTTKVSNDFLVKNKNIIFDDINKSIEYGLILKQNDNVEYIKHFVTNVGFSIIKNNDDQNQYRVIEYLFIPRIAEPADVLITKIMLPDYFNAVRFSHFRRYVFKLIMPARIDFSELCSSTTSLNSSIIRLYQGNYNEGFSSMEIYLIENYLKFKGGIEFYLMLKKDIQNKESEFYKMLVE